MKNRQPKPYTHKHGNVYTLRTRPPDVNEPSPEVKLQIEELEKQGCSSMKLDKEGRVHRLDVEPIDLYVAAEGMRAASWLLFNQRARFHRDGAIDFYMLGGVETPMWFRVAFEYIRRKSRHFFADLIVKNGIRHYLVRWERWGEYSPRKRALVLIAPPANS